MSSNKKTPFGKRPLYQNLLFAGILLLLALGFFAMQQLKRAQEAQPKLVAVLTYGNGTSIPLSLEEDGAYDIITTAYTVHIQVTDGAAAFVDSPCQDHICEQFGWLREKGAWAVCSPAQAILRIEAAA